MWIVNCEFCFLFVLFNVVFCVHSSWDLFNSNCFQRIASLREDLLSAVQVWMCLQNVSQYSSVECQHYVLFCVSLLISKRSVRTSDTKAIVCEFYYLFYYMRTADNGKWKNCFFVHSKRGHLQWDSFFFLFIYLTGIESQLQIESFQGW